MTEKLFSISICNESICYTTVTKNITACICKCVKLMLRKYNYNLYSQFIVRNLYADWSKAYWLVLDNYSYARRAPALNVSTRRNGPRPETRRRDAQYRDRDETETWSILSEMVSRTKRRDRNHIPAIFEPWDRSHYLESQFFYARQLYRQVLLRARISYGNSVRLSVCHDPVRIQGLVR